MRFSSPPALDLSRCGGDVAKDALHFEGSLYQFRRVGETGARPSYRPVARLGIGLRHLDRLIDSKTKLVAVSAVSMATGFQHDLKAVWEMAHSRGG